MCGVTVSVQRHIACYTEGDQQVDTQSWRTYCTSNVQKDSCESDTMIGDNGCIASSSVVLKILSKKLVKFGLLVVVWPTPLAHYRIKMPADRFPEIRLGLEARASNHSNNRGPDMHPIQITGLCADNTSPIPRQSEKIARNITIQRQTL